MWRLSCGESSQCLIISTKTTLNHKKWKQSLLEQKLKNQVRVLWVEPVNDIDEKRNNLIQQWYISAIKHLSNLKNKIKNSLRRLKEMKFKEQRQKHQQTSHPRKERQRKIFSSQRAIGRVNVTRSIQLQ